MFMVLVVSVVIRLYAVKTELIERNITVLPLGALRAVERADGARSIKCIPLIRFFNLELPRAIKASESVGITGNHIKLGAWQVEKALEMKTSDTQRLKWYLRIILCAEERIQYRYFIYRSIEGNAHKRIISWEGLPYARVLEHLDIYRDTGTDYYGKIHETTLADVETERGWLRSEYVVQLKFIWRSHVKFNTNFQYAHARRLRLKLLVYQAGSEVHLNNASSTTELEITRFAYKHSQLRAQPERGVVYDAGDIIIFQLTEMLKRKNSYQLLIMTPKGQQIGYAFMLTTDFSHSEGVIDLPLHSPETGFEIGSLALPYLIVKPLPNAIHFNFRSSFHRYWPPNWPGMDIGHRGVGKSYYDSQALYVENTIKSFLFVERLKADMVELDVQLTKDYVPVLWHGFGFYTAPFGRKVSTMQELNYVLIKDLSYKELKRRRVFVRILSDIEEYTHLNVRSTNLHERIFPKLSEVFERLPKSLGLIIVIKWPQQLQNGKMESTQSQDKNHFVNTLLQLAMQNACGRPLIFSSFDADICTLIRLKQNVFPVIFRSTAESRQWQAFMDLRTHSFLHALNFAQAANLLGTAAHVQDFLTNTSLLDLSLNLGQAVFLWGDELNNAAAIEKFKSFAVSGLIYDQMNLYGPRRKRQTFFAVREFTEIFGRQCAAVASWSSAPTKHVTSNNIAIWSKRTRKTQAVGL